MRRRLAEQFGEALVLALCWLVLFALGWVLDNVWVVEPARQCPPGAVVPPEPA